MRKIYVAPSILSADFLFLNDEIKSIEEAKADFIHFDVMDGSYVNNISFGLPILKSVSKGANLKIDTHLMIINPIKYYKEFYNLGSYNVTVHEETTNVDEFKEMSKYAKTINKSIGITLNPSTDLNKIVPYLKYADIVLVMSVEPGFGGQKFIESSLNKIEFLKDYRELNKLNYLIEVDGGINEETSLKCKEKGADILVAGSFIFNSKNYKERIEVLKYGKF